MRALLGGPLTSQRRRLLTDLLQIQLMDAKAALRRGSGIEGARRQLRGLEEVALRIGSDDQDIVAIQLAAEYWSVLAHCDQAVRRPASAVEHSRTALSRGAGTFSPRDIVRLEGISADALVQTGDFPRALIHAQAAIRLAEEDPYLLARARISLQSVANESNLMSGEIVLSSSDLSAIAGEHSLGLAASGSVLIFRAFRGRHGVDGRRENELLRMEELLAEERGDSLIQRMQFAETAVEHSIALRDFDVAVRHLRDLEAAVVRLPEHDYRLERTLRRFEPRASG